MWMANYIGIRCPVCNKKFASSDDIVVCPLCGAPHHRECYAQQGECAFAADHLSGKEWKPPEPDPEDVAETASQQEKSSDSSSREEDGRICPGCGCAHPESTIFCPVCGYHLNAKSPGQSSMQDFFLMGQIDPLGGVSKDATIGDIPVMEIARYVGPNSARYLPRFHAIYHQGARARTNLSAFFLHFFYYFYRRMYGLGLIMLGIFAACTIPFFLFSKEFMPELLYLYGYTPPPATPINEEAALFYANLFFFTMLAYLIISFIVSLFANRFYLKQVLEGIHALQNPPSETGRPLPRSMLGGVDRMGVVLLIGFLFLSSNLIMTFLMS